jgi:hypothetical protein
MIKLYSFTRKKTSGRAIQDKTTFKGGSEDYLHTSDAVRVNNHYQVLSNNTSQSKQKNQYTPVEVRGKEKIRLVINVSNSPKREFIKKARRSVFGFSVEDIEDTSGV